MTFVTVHRLFSLPPSLPNRGADGLAKRAPYGGVERSRISSQCIKAHLRGMSMDELAASLGEQLSVRSALIGERRIKTELQKLGLPEDKAATSADAIMALFRSGKPNQSDSKPQKKAAAKADTDDDDREDNEQVEEAEEGGRQIVVLGEREIQALIHLAKASADAGLSVRALRDLVEKPTKRKGADKNLGEALSAYDAMRANVGLDGALFGRMATGVAVSRIDSAVHVGHALTVHPVQTSVDFFSAQDDLLAANEAGTAHIQTRELVSGVFYFPVVIDLGQLRRNFGEAFDDQKLRKLIGWLVEAVSTVVPAAMLGSTAPFADPGFVLVTVGPQQPITLVRAFEKPSRPTVEDAAEALRRHAERVWAMTGRPDLIMLDDFLSATDAEPAVSRFASAVAQKAIP